jgi:hypothetical protein
MLALVAFCIVLGALCGAVFRLLPFLVISIVVVILLLSIGIARDTHPLSSVVIAIVTLQVGYGAGVIIRAAVRSYLNRGQHDRK